MTEHLHRTAKGASIQNRQIAMSVITAAMFSWMPRRRGASVCSLLWLIVLATCPTPARAGTMPIGPSGDSVAAVLVFPEGPPLGTVEIRDRIPEDMRDDPLRMIWGWKQHAQARGTVTIPKGHEVYLRFDEQSDKDLSILSQLPTDVVTRINLSAEDVKDEDLRHLSRFTNLKSLALVQTAVTDKGLEHLRDLSTLEYLALGGARGITDEGLQNLSGLTQMRSLSLAQSGVTGSGLKVLQNMVHLQRLNLFETAVTSHGLARLTRLASLQELSTPPAMTDRDVAIISNIKALRRIIFGAEPIVTAEGVRSLQKLENLEVFQIASNTFDDEAVEQLARIKTLKTLWLEFCPVTDKGLAALTTLDSLETLFISGTQMQGEGLAHLSNLPKLTGLILWESRPDVLDLTHLKLFTKLRELEIHTNRPRNWDITAIQGMKDLEYLELSGLLLFDEDLANLADLKSLKELILLGIPHITDTGLKHLEGLTSLEYIGLDKFAGISQEQVTALHAQLPNLKRLERLDE